MDTQSTIKKTCSTCEFGAKSVRQLPCSKCFQVARSSDAERPVLFGMWQLDPMVMVQNACGCAP